MAKTRSERLEKWFYRLAIPVGLGAGLALGNMGCRSPVEVNPPKNNPPQITLNANPQSGMAPLKSRIQYSCTDADGEQDISQSYLAVGADTLRTMSVDSTFTFIQPATYATGAYCKDKAGAEAKTGPLNIQVSSPPEPPPQPKQSFTQSAVTSADSLIATYNATAMENLDSVKVRVQRDGSPADSMIIKKSQIPFTKTYDVPGTYRFISDISGLKPDTATAAVKDYDPNVDFSTIPADSLSMNEGGSISINLESRIKNSDLNKGDNPVVIDSVFPLDGKTLANVNGYLLNINAVGDSIGIYGIGLRLKNSRGKTITKTLQGGQIYDLLDVSGFLEDNEQHQRWPGRIKVLYNHGGVNDSTEISVDNSGEFKRKLEQRVSDLTGDLLVKGVIIQGNDTTSYVRTVKLPARDQRGLLLRVVPCAPYCINKEEFKQFMVELAGSTPNTRFDFGGEFIPGFQGHKGIEILSENPFGAQYGTIASEQQANIRNKILDPNDISGIIGNYIINPDSVLIGNHGHFTLNSTTQEIIPDSGWIIVSPKTNMPENGLTKTYNSGTLIWGGTIYLKSGVGDGTISHEFGHMFIGSGHPTTFGSDQTIMNLSANRPTTGPADKKAGKIIYEPTFMVFPSGKFPNVDNLDNILGLRF